MSGRRGSDGLSVLLMFVGVVALVVGGLCLYVKSNVLDSGELAKRVVASVERSDVRKFIAQRTAAEVVRRVPALAPSRQVVESTANSVVATDQFKSILGTAVSVAENRLVGQEKDNTSMKLRNVGGVIHDQLQAVDPQLAGQVPTNLDAKLASLSGVPALTDTIRVLKTIRSLGTILPPVAVLVLIGSILVAADRRAALGRLGVTLAIAAIALIALSFLGRAVVLGRVPSGLDRSAAGSVWDEVLGPFRTWLIVAGAAGLLIAAGAVIAGRGGPRHAPA